MERVLWPIDPVEPKMASFFTKLFSQIEGGRRASFLQGDRVQAVVDVENREEQSEKWTDFDLPSFLFPVIPSNLVTKGERSGDPHKANKTVQIAQEKRVRQQTSQGKSHDKPGEWKRKENQWPDGATFPPDPQRKIDAEKRRYETASQHGCQSQPAKTRRRRPGTSVIVFKLVSHSGLRPQRIGRLLAWHAGFERGKALADVDHVIQLLGKTAHRLGAHLVAKSHLLPERVKRYLRFAPQGID